MQIDFHFGCVYVLSRAAGFTSASAQIIAQSSQYVDDCKFRGVSICLGREEDRFTPSTTAHKFISRENLRLENQFATLLPFHFLPGGKGETFWERSIVKAESPFIEALWNQVKVHSQQPHGLHLLGIFLHAHADQWAHEGFSAFLSGLNRVKRVTPALESDRLFHRLTRRPTWGKFSRNLLKHLLRRYIAGTFTVGHFEASRRPDIPWLAWEYTNHRRERIERDNPAVFLRAARDAFARLREYLLLNKDWRDTRSSDREWSDLEEEIKTLLLFGSSCREEDAVRRLEAWRDAALDGRFGFIEKNLHYDEREWFESAVFKNELGYRAREGFESSDWKLFQDAAELHRAIVFEKFPKDFFF